MAKSITDRKEYVRRSMKTPTQFLKGYPKKLSINSDGKVHRKNRKKNMDKVQPSGCWMVQECLLR